MSNFPIHGHFRKLNSHLVYGDAGIRAVDGKIGLRHYDLLAEIDSCQTITDVMLASKYREMFSPEKWRVEELDATSARVFWRGK